MRYQATADWMVIRKQGRPQAEIFFVHYALLEDKAHRERRAGRTKKRPVTFLFNGGPGAASAYLHLGAVGPVRTEFNRDGTFTGPPVTLVDNSESWLPFTDLVFVDPVGTGFSRAVEESRNERDPFRFEKGEKDDGSKLFERVNLEKQEFFRVNRDLESLVQFITQFLSRFERWDAPVYLAGESYGGFRVGKLVRQLHEAGGVGLSGAILVSPALDMMLHDRSDYDVTPWIDEFPTMALSAFFHKKARAHRRGATFGDAQAAAERFAVERLSRLLIGGDGLPTKQQTTILDESSDLLGLPRSYVQMKGGRVGFWEFARELLREERKVCGYYDASYLITDPYPDRPYYAGPDPTQTLESTFTAGINAVLRSKLKVKTDRDYHLLSGEVFHLWRVDQERHFTQAQLNSVDDFRFGIAMNEHLRVLIVHGYYDLVTPYFGSQRLVDLMKLNRDQRRQVELENYPGGHMFYTWERSRENLTATVRKIYDR